MQTKRKSYDTEKACASDIARMRAKGWTVLHYVRRPVLMEKWSQLGMPSWWLAARGPSDEQFVVTYGRSDGEASSPPSS